MKDGAFARVAGVHGNHPFKVTCGPNAYIEMTNSEMEKVPSLYRYQLNQRLGK